MKFDPEVARKAKAELAIKLEQIAMKYVPEGYRVEYRKSLSGRHFGKQKLIQAPRPVTRKSLYIFLHECGHAFHKHQERKQPRYVQEYQAEQFAHDKMREEGIAVPRSMTERAKQYVRRKISQAEKRGAKAIDSEVRRWAA